jgi:hypothetical protein
MIPNEEELALIISDVLFRAFGFGPSQSICKPFAQQVIAEARQFRKANDG